MSHDSNYVNCLCLNQREDVAMCLTAVTGRSAPEHCDATADASDQFGGRGEKGGGPKMLDAFGCRWIPHTVKCLEIS